MQPHNNHAQTFDSEMDIDGDHKQRTKAEQIYFLYSFGFTLRTRIRNSYYTDANQIRTIDKEDVIRETLWWDTVMDFTRKIKGEFKQYLDEMTLPVLAGTQLTSKDDLEDKKDIQELQRSFAVIDTLMTHRSAFFKPLFNEVQKRWTKVMEEIRKRTM